MSKLVITRGLPGSGKTTYAEKWVLEDPHRRLRVNRDTLRMMANGANWSPEYERVIQAIRDAAILEALKRGLDVINDDTNLPSRVVRDLRRLAKLTGSEFEVVDLTDTSLQVCIQRNAPREGTPAFVPPERIIEMYRRYIAGKPYPLPIADEQVGPDSMEPYIPDLSKPQAIIVDIDGTVALKGDRSPYDESRVHEDRPNWPVIRAVEAMVFDGHMPIFVSGRSRACEEATRDWLARHILGARRAPLYMRPTHDRRRDAVVKLEIFNNYIRNNYNVVAVFDDREQVVAMWRSLGLTVFQVAEGKF